jgi:hypothetical protein
MDDMENDPPDPETAEFRRQRAVFREAERSQLGRRLFWASLGVLGLTVVGAPLCLMAPTGAGGMEGLIIPYAVRWAGIFGVSASVLLSFASCMYRRDSAALLIVELLLLALCIFVVR